MSIAKSIRDRLLVEARHRCTICAEKCFEIHHIVERAEGGSDEPENLIVLCPNCHQHRYHRHKEFTPDQIRLYKEQLKESNEIEKRVLQNLDEIRNSLPDVGPDVVESKLRDELHEACQLISSSRLPVAHGSIQEASEWLAERDLIRKSARKAIEIEWDARKQREKSKFPEISIQSVDDNAFRKAPDFPAAYYLEFVLSHSPNDDWVQVFDNEYRNSYYSMKRSTTVNLDRLVMIVADSDNFQNHTDFAKGLVQKTNERIQTLVFDLINQSCERGKREALKQFDTIQSMKLRTKNIRL